MVHAGGDGQVARFAYAPEIGTAEVRRAQQLGELALLRLEYIGVAHGLLDGLAHGNLLDVVHVAPHLLHIFLA
ncbi:MAG: hypothetical protein ACK4UX_04850 [Thiobacillus sp.]